MSEAVLKLRWRPYIKSLSGLFKSFFFFFLILFAGKDKIKVSEDDLKKLPLIKWCILETIRLRAPGVIARKVLKPVKILVSFDFVLK